MTEIPALLKPISTETVEEATAPPSRISMLADAARSFGQDERTDFLNSMETVAPLNPDGYAKATAIAKYAGLPAKMLYDNAEYREKLLRGNQYAGIYDRYKKTANALRNGNLAAVSQDDIDQLTRIEGAASDTRFNEQSSGEKLWGAIRQQWIGLRQATNISDTADLVNLSGQFDTIDAEIARAAAAGEQPFATIAEPGGFGGEYLRATPDERLVMRQNLAEQQGEQLRSAQLDAGELAKFPVDPGARRAAELQAGGESSLAATAEALMENPGFAARTAAGASATSAPMLVAGAFGGPLVAGAVGYNTEYDTKLLDVLKEAGADPADPKSVLRVLQDDVVMADAEKRASRKAAGTTAVDLLSMSLASKVLAPTRVAGRELSQSQRELVNLAVQFPVQGITEGAGEAAGQLAAEGKVDAGEVLLEAVSGSAMSSLDVLAFSNQRLIEGIGDGLRKARDARVSNEARQEMVDAALNSKTRGRERDSFGTIAEAQLKDSPMETIWLPAEALQRLNQSAQVDLPALLQEVPGLGEQFADAVARGGSVTMKMADYLRVFADYDQQLGDSVRTNVDGMSTADVEAWTSEQEAQMDDLAAALKRGPDAQATAYDETVGQLVSAGFRRADAEQYAATHLSVMNNLAERTGVALEQLRQRFDLNIATQVPEQLRSIPVDDARLALQRLRAGDIPQASDMFGQSLREFLVARGGVSDEGGELAALDADVGRTGRNRLTRKGGGSIDDAAMAAYDAGYFPGIAREQVTPQLVVDAIGEEMRGQPRYSAAQENATLAGQAQTLNELNDYLQQLGVDINEMSDDEVLNVLRNPEQLEGQRLDQFAGPTAWTADVPALNDAQARIADGENPEQVRKDTGWFEGVDGKWRFEIDDSNATFKPLEDWVERAEQNAGVTLADALDHPALFAAYPELARVEVHVDPERQGGGMFVAEAGRGFVGAFIEIADPASYGQESQAIDVLMHEIQHAIQAREGFATGGSPEVLRTEKDQAMADRDYWAAVATIRRDADRLGGDFEQAARDYVDVFEQQVSDQQMADARGAESVEQLDQRVQQAEKVMRTIGNPTATYTRLAGEIEARNTEARRSMTAAERQAASPEQTADIPGERAIVWWNGTEMVSPTVSEQAAPQETRLNQSGVTDASQIKGLDDELQNLADELLANGAEIDANGNVTVYHRTNKQAADAIRSGGQMTGAEDGLFFSTRPTESQATGFGDEVLAFNIPIEELELDDAFGNEAHVRIPLEHAGEQIDVSRWLQQDRRLEQGGEDDTARGHITFKPRDVAGQNRKFQITLGEKRDLSTLLHELGHYYLEVIDDIAASENAPAQIVNDVATIRQWVGAEEGAALTTDQHEQFARGFEAYLAEGKAPNPELAGAFARFKRWLIAIYKDLRRLNVELSDDVRRVFDRLVATDEQITAAEQVSNAIPLFADAQKAGMTDAEFTAYQNSIELAHADARDAVEEEVVREEERRRSKWWREESERVRQEVTEEVDLLPQYTAINALRRGVMPDGTPTQIKLNSSELVERYGQAATRKMAFTHARNGVPLDVAAEMLGFQSGDEMVKAVMGAPSRGEMIRRETEQRMLERHGPKSSGEAAERALDAVHNERRADVLAKELRRLGEVGNRRNITSQQILKEAARRVMEDRLVRDIQPAEYQRAEAKAGREAFQAFTRGDLEAAYEAKQRQLLNFYMYREARKARDGIAKIVDRMAGYNKRSKREQLGKAGADYLDQIDAVMEQYEFRNISLRNLDKAKSAAQWYSDQVAQGNDPYVPEFVLQTAQRVNYKDLSYARLQELDEYVGNINHLAKIKNKLLKNAKIKDIAEGKAMLTASAFANVDKLPRRKLVDGARSLPEVMSDWLARGNSSLLKMEQVIDWLDGGDPNGAWSSLIFQPLAEAQHEADDLNKKYTQKVVDIHKRWIAERGSEVGNRFHVTSINEPMTTSGMLAVALNSGNASNQKKMLEGRGWDQSVADEILGHMTKADWQFVQDMWETVESLWPQIEALEKRVNGVAPPKVEGLTIDTQFGKVKGGYWPLVYDPLSTRYADVLSNLGGLAPLGEGGTVRATPPRGHTQARVDGFAAPILLDSSVIANHLNQVILDLTHREVLRDVRKLYTGEVREAVTRTLGPDMAAQLVNQFDGIATGQSSGNLQAIGTFARTMNTMRSNLSLAWMGYSVTTVLNQLGGYSQGLEYFAKKESRKYILRAFLKFWGAPLENLQMIREVSGEMRNRAINLDASIREAQTQVLRMKDGRVVQDAFKGMQNARDVMVKYAFVPMQTMQGFVDGVVWMAGYEQAGGVNNHDEAVQAADRAVRLTQTAGGAKDLATIQQNTLAKLFLPVYGYASLLWNRNVDIWQSTKQAVKARDPKQVLIAFERFVYLNIIPGFIAALIKGGLPDDDDDDDTWANWLAVTALSSVTQGIPVVGQGVAGAFSDFGYSGASPVGQGLDSLIRASNSEKGQTISTNAINALGAFTGLPASQINRGVRTMFMVENGEMDDSASAIMRGILFGPKKDN